MSATLGEVVFPGFSQIMVTDHIRSIFERVAHRMVHAGWLESYGYSVGGGNELVWRTEGAQKAFLLKDLVERFGLSEKGSRVLCFDMACRGLALPSGVSFSDIDIEVSAFWLLCVSELAIENESESLIGMVKIVTTWSPDKVASNIAAGVER